MTITRSDRRELTALIKLHFKTLRAEVVEREAKMTAEVETMLAERYRDEDALIQECQGKAAKIAAAANAQLQELMDEYAEQFDGGTWSRVSPFWAPHVYRRNREDREQVRKAMAATIKARTRTARLEIDRREADLLRSLAMDAIEGTDAKAVARALPGIDEVAPKEEMRRLAMAAA